MNQLAVRDATDTRLPCRLREMSHESSMRARYYVEGPQHDELERFICSDTNQYVAEPLKSEVVRRMIASAAFAVIERCLTGSYDTLIGEDISGRFPALIIGQAANYLRTLDGLPLLQRYFLSGKLDIDHAPPWDRYKIGRPLLITDYVATGETIRNITGVLQHMDIMTPDILMLGGKPELLPIAYGGASQRVWSGDLARTDPELATKLVFTRGTAWKGLSKIDGEAHARVVDDEGARPEIVAARREARLFATAIALYYLDTVTH